MNVMGLNEGYVLLDLILGDYGGEGFKDVGKDVVEIIDYGV